MESSRSRPARAAPRVVSEGIRRQRELARAANAEPTGREHGSRASTIRPNAPTLGGRYRIDELLAEGGMGRVYKGWHTRLHRPIAIKILRSRYKRNRLAVRLFLHEARTGASLDGIHAPVVFDIGIWRQHGVPYIVTELLEGRDLRTMLEAGELDGSVGPALFLEACAAVASAHAKGIVHRDLKPDNLFVTGLHHQPEIKLLDFGIAKTADEHDTPSGMTVGSPHYMAPEQVVAPHAVDVRADVWSLGIVLFELLTGELPFDGASTSDVCAAVLHGTARPPSSVRKGLSPAFDEIVLKCLSKLPADRYSDVHELMAALEPLVRHDGGQGPPHTSDEHDVPLVEPSTKRQGPPAEDTLLEAAPVGQHPSATQVSPQRDSSARAQAQRFGSARGKSRMRWGRLVAASLAAWLLTNEPPPRHANDVPPTAAT